MNVLVENAEIALPHVMELLKNERVNVNKVSITKPTLDDVFLKYAGTKLEDKARLSDVTHMRYRIRKG